MAHELGNVLNGNPFRQRCGGEGVPRAVKAYRLLYSCPRSNHLHVFVGIGGCRGEGLKQGFWVGVVDTSTQEAKDVVRRLATGVAI